MGSRRMTEQFDMFAGRYLIKLVQISRTSFVGINYSNGETVGKFFLHDFGNLITAFLMVTAARAYQCLYKICVNITLRNYEIGTLVHLPRYASRL